MRLAVLVGHTEDRPGSKGVFPMDMHEYKFNKEIAIDLWRDAKEYGIDCQVFTRDGLSWDKVGQMINDYCGDAGVCLELHCNALNGKVVGTETLYDDDPKESKELAFGIQTHMCIALERSRKDNKGIRLVHEVDQKHLEWKARGLTNLRAIKVPSCIVEPVFWDNYKEAGLLWRNRNQYVRGLVLGVLEFYRLRRDFKWKQSE